MHKNTVYAFNHGVWKRSGVSHRLLGRSRLKTGLLPSVSDLQRGNFSRHRNALQGCTWSCFKCKRNTFSAFYQAETRQLRQHTSLGAVWTSGHSGIALSKWSDPWTNHHGKLIK